MLRCDGGEKTNTMHRLRGEEIKIPGKDTAKAHNKKHSLSLFNMINCEIVKVVGINKHEDDCEQCKKIFYVPL